MSPRHASGDLYGPGRLDTVAAWALGLLWVLPLLYAVWTAFHPGEYSARFVWNAPLTLDNFARAWQAAPFPRYFANTFLLVTMVLADLITRSFKEQGTTMRGMPFPEYVPENIRDALNAYYSISQLCATAQVMFSYRLDEAFLVLFPIQIAAFLMTCVRKSIISAGAWHFYYALALGLNPKAFFRGFTVAGCEPDEMGIGPVFSVPKLLKARGLSVADIDLWELNEAFASQCLYARDRLEIDNAKYNVNGGSISIGHPFGMTGSRQVGHLVRELQRRNLRYGIVTMCVGGGMGATGLFEAVR
mgnify:CR=1 FL=1